jgi:flagellum-specific peptidoglycan hydrolase FlgJ
MKTIIISLLLMATTCQAQTVDQVAKELHRQQVPHPHIVLAQARLETGNFKSDRCRRGHNLFGIKHNGKYAKYSTWQASVADYKKRISARYKGGDYYQFLTRIGYAADRQYVTKLKQF